MAFRSFAANVVPGVLDTRNARKIELSQLRSEQLVLLRLSRRSSVQSERLCSLQESISELERELGLPQMRPRVTICSSTPLVGSLNKSTHSRAPKINTTQFHRVGETAEPSSNTITPATSNCLPALALSKSSGAPDTGEAVLPPDPIKTVAPAPPKSIQQPNRRSISRYYEVVGISPEVLETYIPLISAESKQVKMLLAPAIQEAVNRGFDNGFILGFIKSGPRFGKSFQYLNYLTLCKNERAYTLAQQTLVKIVLSFTKKATADELDARLHNIFHASTKLY